MKKKIIALAIATMIALPICNTGISFAANNIVSIEAEASNDLEAIDIDYKTKKYPAPSIKKITNEVNGAKLNWNRVKGVNYYEISRYNAKIKKWEVIGVKKSTKKLISYLDKDVTSGKTYKYKVRCMKSDKKTTISKYSKALKNKYISVPQLDSITSAKLSATLTWKAPKGATNFAILRKEKNTKWQIIGYTKDKTYTDKLKTGDKIYYYTVQCVDKNKNVVSSYNVKGLSVYVISPKHKHDWKEITKTVHHDEEYHYEDKEVKTYHRGVMCTVCYKKWCSDCLGSKAEECANNHISGGEPDSHWQEFWREDIQAYDKFPYGSWQDCYVEHITTEKVKVVDKEAYDEEVVIAKKCKTCGKYVDLEK